VNCIYGSAEGPLAGSCEHSNEPSGSIKGREFIQLNDYEFLKKDSAPWSQSKS
jgi:hypothetical protein